MIYNHPSPTSLVCRIIKTKIFIGYESKNQSESLKFINISQYNTTLFTSSFQVYQIFNKIKALIIYFWMKFI